MKKREYKEQERQRHYYFFDYLFWLGEITWENYHKVNSKQPRGNDMLLVCIMFFILMPVLTIGGHFLYDHDRLIFELFSAVLLIVFAIVAIARDRLLGEIYPPSRRKAVMRHYAGRKFSPARRNLFFFPLFVLLIPAMVLLSTALKGITDNEAKPVENTRTEVPQRWRDYLALHITVGARQEVPSEALQYLIDQDGRTSRYGQPVYVMQVRATEGDMGGEFRAGLLNHATFEEIQDGRRKFVECTWVKGYTPDSIRVLLTGWYEVNNAGLCPVDSLEWTEDTEF
ncbi:hypothetical protein DW230_23135 [Bacteroides sp. AM18-9]|nr:hypothetical protein DW230_23135 [Bacteroides sp. AM18-9]